MKRKEKTEPFSICC